MATMAAPINPLRMMVDDPPPIAGDWVGVVAAGADGGVDGSPLDMAAHTSGDGMSSLSSRPDRKRSSMSLC